MNWSERFATRTLRMKPSAIREILKLTQGGQVISFAGGLPAPHLFPVEQLRRAAETVLTQSGREALQYSTTEGYRPLREWVAARLQASAEEVQIVSGSQQALDLVAKLFLNPGDTVVVGAPTYVGALRAFDAYEVEYVSVPTDDEGMLPDALEAALKTQPKLVYVIPNFDNPTGVTVSLERRRAMVELARRYGVPILEDNPYGELRFEGAELPNLYTLAPDVVLYAGTFSKIMVPGFRLAWVLADPQVVTLLTRAKQATDLHTATYTQMIAFEAAKDRFIDAHVLQVRDYYREQRDLMLRALAAHMSREVRWTRPAGGMFLWLTLPEDMNASDIAYDAVQQNVAYVPGETFFTDGSSLNTLRLSYSVASAEEIDEGVRRLSGVFKAQLENARVH
ncbi:MAG: Aspartate aminotransferase (AspB-4) [uncultured Truepera sp.]|uniref:Aspartate aminotransferase (AspB-4) n=1 Tax=uncultured Truepera sp. TaxID=543023 RepID=A0A6J4VBS8_9DEIN|nr:MAG: Aspartate aminotransferase (AspB-4) [uncultured Truepera sp.]